MAHTLNPSNFQLPGHILLLNRYLTELAFGHIDRLIITLPVRHGKSMLTSEIFPAWYLSHFPDHNVGIVTYTHDLARGFSRSARDLFEAQVGPLVGLKLNPDVKGQAEWRIKDHRGGCYGVGVGGSLVGRGFNLLIFDDPLKNAAEALRKTTRDAVDQFFRGTAYNRMEPGGKIVLIQARYHHDDLAGRLLTDMEDGHGDNWTILNLPAIAIDDESFGDWSRKKGEPLWPERYDLEALERARQMDPFWFSALFQQDPQAEEGTMFDREWFEVIPHHPYDLENEIRYWDFASTEAKHGSDPDWTVGTRYGWSRSLKKWVVADVVRARTNPGGVEQIVRQTAATDGREIPIWMEVEPGSAGKSLLYHYQTKVLRAYTVQGHKPTGDKTVRAMPLSALAQSNLIVLVRGTWVRDWLAEIELFPLGPHDDQVDSLSGAHDVIATKFVDFPDIGPLGIAQESKWRIEL